MPPHAQGFTGTALLCLSSLVACGGSSPTSPSQRNCTAVTTRTLNLAVGEVFRAEFRVPAGVTREVIVLSYLGLPESGFVAGRISHKLYDGARLLGAQENSETIAIWKSPESSFGMPNDPAYGFSYAALSVDFTSLVNGTIDGRVELSPVSGPI